jgi:hypothetical protein
VLAYDLRNSGLSGAANGGIASSGIFESRAVLGSLRYARERRDTGRMTIGLFSRCLGCSSTFYAMTMDPRAFDGVRCLPTASASWKGVWCCVSPLPTRNSNGSAAPTAASTATWSSGGSPADAAVVRVPHGVQMTPRVDLSLVI